MLRDRTSTKLCLLLAYRLRRLLNCDMEEKMVLLTRAKQSTMGREDSSTVCLILSSVIETAWTPHTLTSTSPRCTALCPCCCISCTHVTIGIHLSLYKWSLKTMPSQSWFIKTACCWYTTLLDEEWNRNMTGGFKNMTINGNDHFLITSTPLNTDLITATLAHCNALSIVICWSNYVIDVQMKAYLFASRHRRNWCFSSTDMRKHFGYLYLWM